MRKLFLFRQPIRQLNVHRKYITVQNCARESFCFIRTMTIIMCQKDEKKKMKID